MSFLSRIFGICKTPKPSDDSCWSFSDGQVTVHLGRVPELKNTGGAIRLEGKGLPIRLLVLNGQDGVYHALHNRCTHAGRRLDPLPGQPGIECCSVGKSGFDYSGAKLAGPAKGPVTAFPVENVNGTLSIHLSGGRRV